MAKTRAVSVQKAPRSEVSGYKTAEAEERAIIRRLRRYRAKLQKEMEGMTIQEQVDYYNKLGNEAVVKLGIAEKPPNKPCHRN